MTNNKLRGCKWEGSCNCGDKTECCQNCTHYHFLDSGYGDCYALPEIVMVAWCKDTCALFDKRGK